MASRILALVITCGLCGLFACAVEDVPVAEDNLAAAQSQLAPAPVPEEPPPDGLICDCFCNGVLVQVKIYPDRHGETCNSVNGRPCNTGGGWFVYKGC
ncbi:MAG: hypothetical protein R3B48_15280 [Kofleriaceae bacterium]